MLDSGVPVTVVGLDIMTPEVFDSYPVEVVTKVKAAEFFPRYRAAI